jgi:hypothetical protein
MNTLELIDRVSDFVINSDMADEITTVCYPERVEIRYPMNPDHWHPFNDECITRRFTAGKIAQVALIELRKKRKEYDALHELADDIIGDLLKMVGRDTRAECDDWKNVTEKLSLFHSVR